MPSVIAKFGGSSVGDAQKIAQSVSIVVENPLISLVVVSATAGTTNFLEEFASKALSSTDEAINLWDRLLQRHLLIARELGAGYDSPVIEELRDLFCEGESLALRAKEEGTLRPEMMASFYALGERMSSPLFAYCLQGQLKKNRIVIELDAREVLWTDEEFLAASPLKESIFETANQKIDFTSSKKIYVTQGFIGGTIDGRTTVFGREGSDFSAALFAEALRAKELQIWTDVPGVATCDPRVVDQVSWIDQLDFEEASFLARGGAKILHPETLSPIRELGIPVYIGDSQRPHYDGTWIMSLCDDLSPRLIGMSFNRSEVSLVGFKINKIKDDIIDKLKTLDFQLGVLEVYERCILLTLPTGVELSKAVKKMHKLFNLDNGYYTP